MDPIIEILNEIIAKNLPTINSHIDSAIKSKGLDPKQVVTSGSKTLGRINLGVCHASAGANYDVSDLTGLSGFQIDTLTISEAGQNPEDDTNLNGNVVLTASFGSNLHTRLGGHVKAKCGFIHPSVGISGSVTITKVSASGNGTFSASSDGTKICLDKVLLDAFSVNYGDIDIHINELGIFNALFEPLEEAIIDLFKGDIRSDISKILTPILNSEIHNILPICQKLG